MSLIKHSVLSSVFLLVLVASCGNPESVVTTASKSADPDATAQSVNFSVQLRDSNSRTQRFLGSFDDIDRLALDFTRNYGNKQIAVDQELTKDNATGKWSGTIENLIINFDYTVVGHAYEQLDNGSFVEIFTGETQHTVATGTNSLSLRLSPVLDERELGVPRITRIERPFQIKASTTENVTVSVDSGDAFGGEIFYSFRSVDEQAVAITDPNIGGSFSPEDTSQNCASQTCADVATAYSATDNYSTQRIQVRVANGQEIGVVTHFSIYVTDQTIFDNSSIDMNPVIESLYAEVMDNGTLKWAATVSNDDGASVGILEANWDYRKNGQTGLRHFETLEAVQGSDTNRIRFEALMSDYQSTDDGYLYLTVCEDGPVVCEYGVESSTTLEFRLIAGAYTKPLVCDGDFCGFGIWDQSTWDSTTFGD
jgi:hypothetical protein